MPPTGRQILPTQSQEKILWAPARLLDPRQAPVTKKLSSGLLLICSCGTSAVTS